MKKWKQPEFFARNNRLSQLERLESRYLLAAEDLLIQVENLSPAGGLFHTPVWVATHDGTFDIADPAMPASNFDGLEELAEEGQVNGLANRFTASGAGEQSTIAAPITPGKGPVFEPEETVSQVLSIADTQHSRFFSFASMILPSNDAFIANLDPRAFEIFDASGTFLGPQSFVLTGQHIWDAGTEVNDPTGGAAFTTAGGTAQDESGVISTHPGLNDFIGANLPTGTNLARAFDPLTPLVRLTVSLASAPAAPVDLDAPESSMVVEDIDARAAAHTIQVTYYDASGIDVSSITTDDILVIGPNLWRLPIESVSTDAAPGTTPRTVVATYTIEPTTGELTHRYNGTFVVQLQDGAVRDVFAQPVAASELGNFDIEIPVRLQVEIESLGDLGGLSQTPFWLGFHEGNFEVARAGVAAAEFPGLEQLAEEGILTELIDRFELESHRASLAISSPGGFGGAPIFEPDETVVVNLDVPMPALNRYLSFATMVLPSNDAFIANLNPRSYELFDRFGDFRGSQTITLYGTDVWDAGTEVNDPSGGAAFTTAGGTSVSEDGVIAQHPGLDAFIGTELASLSNLDMAFGAITPLARISISLSDTPQTPSDNHGPRAETSPSSLSLSTDYHEIEITYADPSGIDINSIDPSDLEVLSNFQTPLSVLSVTTDAVAGTTPRSVTATYRVAPPAGSGFSATNNGLYSVVVTESSVSDTLGNPIEAKRVGEFAVQLPVELQVTVENLGATDGLFQTPFWVGFHDGSFEIARLGVNASQFPGLEALAEDGDTSDIESAFANQSSGTSGVIGGPAGFGGAPVLDPGESASQSFELLHTDLHRYFSYASMVIPSNDAFLANLNSQAIEVFNEQGFFNGPTSITIYGQDILDAGTEVNNPLDGAAFTSQGGTGVDEGGVIRKHSGLEDFVGQPLVTGNNLGQAYFDQSPIARITISLANSPSSAIDLEGPVGSLPTPISVTQAGQEEVEFTIAYSDPSGIDLTRFDESDLRIVGPLGQELVIQQAVVNATSGSTPTTVEVTYTAVTADGEFTARNNGRYEVSIIADEVGDVFAQGNALHTVGELRVDVGIRIQLEVESLTPAGGLFLTPVWFGVHDGNFEIGRAGVSADAFTGLELLAEEGDLSELVDRFDLETSGIGTTLTAPGGFPSAPVFDPGESATAILEVTETNANRFLSFASMVIPSNDAFLANLNPRQLELFDSQGNFQGARQFTLYGRDILDAGTEENNPSAGAAFTSIGGTDTDEDNVIRRHPGLEDFVDTQLATGNDLQSAFEDDTPILRITISMIDPEAPVCSGVIAACSIRSVDLHNQNVAFDVNRDNQVSALDVLLLVNFLNEFGTTSTLAEEARAAGLLYDVSDDESISNFDALLVVNRINEGGEAESVGTTREREQETAVDLALLSIPQESFDHFDDDQ